MSCIHFKFSNTVENEKLKFEGLHISVGDLRDAIIKLKNLKANLYTLRVVDAQSKKDYSDDKEMLPRNSSVVVSRVPLANTRVPKSKYKDPSLPQSEHSSFPGISSTSTSLSSTLGPKDLSADKGVLSAEELRKTGDLANANASEEAKVKAMITQSTDIYDPSQYVWTRGGNKNASFAAGKDFTGLKNPPPASYICYRCGNRGHWIQMCPTNGDPNYNNYKYKRSMGIPSSQIVSVHENVPGAMLDRHGQLVIKAVDLKAVNDAKVRKQQQHSSEKEPPKENIPPPELVCGLCKKLMKDAVIIPCCGESYCYECIQVYLCENEFTCPACKKENVSPENLAPNKALRLSAKNFQMKVAEDRSVAVASITGFVRKAPIVLPPAAPLSVAPTTKLTILPSVAVPAKATVAMEKIEDKKEGGVGGGVTVAAMDADRPLPPAPVVKADPIKEEETRNVKEEVVDAKVTEEQSEIGGHEKEKKVLDEEVAGEERTGVVSEDGGGGGDGIDAKKEMATLLVKASNIAKSRSSSPANTASPAAAAVAIATVAAASTNLIAGATPPHSSSIDKVSILPMQGTVAIAGRPAVPLTSAVPLGVGVSSLLGQGMYPPPPAMLMSGLLPGQPGLLNTQRAAVAGSVGTTASTDPDNFNKLAAELLLNTAIAQKRPASPPLSVQEFYRQQKLLKKFNHRTGHQHRSTSHSNSSGSYSRSNSFDSSLRGSTWSRSSSSSGSDYSRSRSRSPVYSKSGTASRKTRKHQRSKKHERLENKHDDSWELEEERRRRRKEHQAEKERREKEHLRDEPEGKGAERSSRHGSKKERSKRHRHSRRKEEVEEGVSGLERDAKQDRSSQRESKHRHHHHRGGSRSPDRKKKRLMVETTDVTEATKASPVSRSLLEEQRGSVTPQSRPFSEPDLEEDTGDAERRSRHKKRKKKQKHHQRSRHGSRQRREEVVIEEPGEVEEVVGVDRWQGSSSPEEAKTSVPVEVGDHKGNADMIMTGVEAEVPAGGGDKGSGVRSGSDGGEGEARNEGGEAEARNEGVCNGGEAKNEEGACDGGEAEARNEGVCEGGEARNEEGACGEVRNEDGEGVVRNERVCDGDEGVCDGGEGDEGACDGGGECLEEAVEIALPAEEMNSLVGNIQQEDSLEEDADADQRGEGRQVQVNKKEQASGTLPIFAPPPLTKSDLPSILDVLEPLMDWRSLGLELRVPARKLNHIQHKFPVETLEKVLLIWISQQENCSWKYLLAALRKIGEFEKANRIARKCLSGNGTLGKEEGEISDSDEDGRKHVKSSYVPEVGQLPHKDEEPDLRETINSQKNSVTRKRKPPPMNDKLINNNEDVHSPAKRPKKSSERIQSIASSITGGGSGLYHSDDENSFTDDDSDDSSESSASEGVKDSRSSRSKKHLLHSGSKKSGKSHDRHDHRHHRHHRGRDQSFDRKEKKSRKEKKRRKHSTKERKLSSANKPHKLKKSEKEKKRKYRKHKKSSLTAHLERSRHHH